ncbi:class I SAM-dependent methyltransferase [Haloterrigena salinisoli]|uniref:SAM-dependent methyltransferase n=1 Tax=Haloterrigena salinisoli TaxID=3132747 RepID=UPI0030CB8A26
MAERADIDSVRTVYETVHEKLVSAGRTHDQWGLRHGFYEADVSEEAAATKRMRDAMLDRVELDAEDHVLDIGCGFGTSSIWLADTVGATVTGTNIVRDQLTIARELADRRDVSDAVEFLEDDFHRLSIDESAVDVVWACEALCYAHRIERVLAELDRVLTDGGRLVVADLFRVTERGRTCEHVAEFENCWKSTIAHRDDIVELLTDRGFETTVTDVTPHVRLTIERRYRYGLSLRPLQRFRYNLGRCDETDVEYARGLIAEHRAVDRGTLRYFLITAERR